MDLSDRHEMDADRPVSPHAVPPEPEPSDEFVEYADDHMMSPITRTERHEESHDKNDRDVCHDEFVEFADDKDYFSQQPQQHMESDANMDHPLEKRTSRPSISRRSTIVLKEDDKAYLVTRTVRMFTKRDL